jgi:hypothetical protein
MSLEDYVNASGGRCARCGEAADDASRPRTIPSEVAGKRAPVVPARKRGLRARAMGVSSAAFTAIKRIGGRRQGAPAEPQPESSTTLLVVTGALAVVVFLAIAIYVALGGSTTPGTHKQTPPTEPVSDGPPPIPLPPSSSPEKPKAPPPPLPAVSEDMDSQRRGQLGMLKAAAIQRARAGNFAGADDRLDALRRLAMPEDRDVVESAEREVESIRSDWARRDR